MRKKSSRAVGLSTSPINKAVHWPSDSLNDAFAAAERLRSMAGVESEKEETNSFLDLENCEVCKKRMSPGQDTFMYSDQAYCSMRCRSIVMIPDLGYDPSASATTQTRRIN